MKLAILQNSDVMEKNQYRIRIQRPKISKDLLVSFNAQKKGQILLPCVIKPIYKGDQNKISNYRPIAILPIISKIIERAVTDQFVAFLILNKPSHPHSTCLPEKTFHHNFSR